MKKTNCSHMDKYLPSHARNCSQTKTTHTPGPWTLLHRKDAPTPFGVSSSANDYPGGFKELGVVYGGCREDEYGANARLIAAAPELLAALKCIADGAVNDLADAQATARAAIAKAEGK